MHELSVAQALVRAVVDVARERKVKKVFLVIGELTFLNLEQLRFAYEVSSKGTVAEGAELVIRETKAHYTCQCGSEGEMLRVEDMHGAPIFSCPKCGSDVEISSGRECFVESIDVETD